MIMLKDLTEDKIEKLSDTQLYRQAGNSIVVPVLIAIFKELFFDDILNS